MAGTTGGLALLIGAFGSLWLIALWLFCAAMAASAARTKREPALAWLLVGLLFGPFALLALAAHGPSGRRCPRCDEIIGRRSQVCPACGVTRGRESPAIGEEDRDLTPELVNDGTTHAQFIPPV